ncbi:1347_t:CDS:1 [Entrophospora sp. SA101]|nr:1347_t:CDS:1 [Entrophospora sp. SA101]
MANVHTLRDISSNKGYHLGSMRERELEETLHRSLKSISELNDCNEGLQSNYLKRVKAFDRERKGWNWDSLRNNTEIQKLCTHTLQVINENKQLQNENTNLISHNAQKDIFIAESKAENVTKSKKIRSLESMIKILEGKLASAQKDVISTQKDSVKKESEILTLKSELASKVNELEHLKSEAKSKPVIGGDDEKNTQSEEQSSITKSDDISTVLQNRQLGDSSNHDTHVSSEESEIRGYASSSKDLRQYFLCRKNDTEIIPKVIDEIDISKNNNNILQEIPNVTPYLAQPENDTHSLIRSHPQILMGGVEAIPVMASTLMSLLSAYMLLALLIIAVMWFVVLRRTWGLKRKSERLRDAWAG